MVLAGGRHTEGEPIARRCSGQELRLKRWRWGSSLGDLDAFVMVGFVGFEFGNAWGRVGGG